MAYAMSEDPLAIYHRARALRRQVTDTTQELIRLSMMCSRIVRRTPRNNESIHDMREKSAEIRARSRADALEYEEILDQVCEMEGMSMGGKS